MPDWSYRPLLRPLLFRLLPGQARGLTLRVVGDLGRHRAGQQLLDRVGRLRPHASLARQVMGLTFRAPVGLAAGLDVDGRAVLGLATFGLGFVEVGPLTLEPFSGRAPASPAPVWSGPIAGRQVAREQLTGPDLPVNAGAVAARAALEGARVPGIPLLARLAHAPHSSDRQVAEERLWLIRLLGPVADAFTLDLSAREAEQLTVDTLRPLVTAASRPVLLALPPDLEGAVLATAAEIAAAAGVAGLLLKDTLVAEGLQRSGPDVLTPTLLSLRRLRQQCGPDTVLIAGGAHTPQDVHTLLADGATLVQLRAGLVFHGPGLAQRAHEALTRRVPPVPAPTGWPWMALVGLGLAFGGALVSWVGLTTVLLPYDETFLQLTLADLYHINPHLLPFLMHDRLTLAGTLVSIGVLYSGLAVFPLRRGMAWAWEALVASGTLGFLSFGLFLGYGYFDPLHATVALLLLVMFLLGLRGRPRAEGLVDVPDLANDRAWRLGMAGQLLWVVTGVGLVLAGLTISVVGVTQVFVPQDLMFLHTTADALHSANPRLVSLIAHDRAGFGGALVSSGVGVLLSVLWGYRRGARWLWWTLLAAGLPGFTAALWIHRHVGYLNAWHLAPAVLGLGLFVAALALSARFLHSRPGRHGP